VTMARAERDVQIKNRMGMHARAAVRFVQLANGFKSEVKVIKDGTEANGKSIMGLLTLVGAHGVTMTIVCEGEDAPAAVTALAELVDTGFGEGIDPFVGGGG
jgi:phosphocarrier protein HPr